MRRRRARGSTKTSEIFVRGPHFRVGWLNELVFPNPRAVENEVNRFSMTSAIDEERRKPASTQNIRASALPVQDSWSNPVRHQDRSGARSEERRVGKEGR